VRGEKVGYIINFDNTMLRKSRVQDYCGPPNLHGVEMSRLVVDIIWWSSQKFENSLSRLIIMVVICEIY
jgi:hypothetical protein